MFRFPILERVRKRFRGQYTKEELDTKATYLSAKLDDISSELFDMLEDIELLAHNYSTAGYDNSGALCMQAKDQVETAITYIEEARDNLEKASASEG